MVNQTSSREAIDNLGRPKARSVSDTSSDNTCFSPLGPRCGELRCFIYVDTFVFALNTTRVALHGDRCMRGRWLSICPTCDAYLLMEEFTWSVLFYSRHDMAVISIADFGCGGQRPCSNSASLRFTPRALQGALEMLRGPTPSDGREGIPLNALNRALLGATESLARCGTQGMDRAAGTASGKKA